MAAERGDILVVVDILRFSTAAVTAVHHGVALYPCTWNEDIHAFAQRVNAIAGGHRAGEDGRYTLSPLSYLQVEPGVRITLASPNGATCARYARSVPALFLGALVNAQAVAAAVSRLLDTTNLNVTVLACGERWQTPSEDGDLRFAIEDYLGAGAIFSYLPQTKSPEALLCATAFQQTIPLLAEMLLECGSGRELQARGQADDVRHAANLNLYDTVPVMRDECLVRF
jgi:2-phosphosulfolactate phosphatase